MTRLCIVFDRLRSEEKMLQREADALGCQTLMLDAKTVRLNTDTAGSDMDLGDVVLERCISYFRGLHMTAALEFLQVPVINRLEVAYACGNKMMMTLRLKKAGVRTPKTHFALSGESATATIKEAGYPLVIKPVVGSWGRGVIPIRNRDTLDAILEGRAVTDGPFDRTYYMQEVVEGPDAAAIRDIRVITVGGEAVAAMYRRSAGGFRSNVALGGDPEMCEITPEMRELAAAASDAVGGGILGVDMLEDAKSSAAGPQLVVHEVNNTVEFKGLSKVSPRNIPRAMIEFAVGCAKR